MDTKKQNRPEYEYSRFMGRYNIYHMEYTENGSTGTKIAETRDREEARKMVYELNGWEYKPSK